MRDEMDDGRWTMRDAPTARRLTLTGVWGKDADVGVDVDMGQWLRQGKRKG